MPLQTNINLLDTVMKTRPGAQPGQEANAQQAMSAMQQPGANVQAVGAALASSQGQENLKQTQQVLAETAPKMEEDVSASQRAARAEASVKELSYQRLAEKNAQRVSDLGIEADQRINKDMRQFKLDESKRKYMNQDMLDTYVMEKTMGDEQLKDYVNTANIMYTRKAALAGAYAKQLDQVLSQGYLREKGDLDRKSIEIVTRIAAQAKKDEQDALKRARARAVKSSFIVQGLGAVGAIVGGVVGGVVTKTPQGAIGGAGMGQAAGSVVGTAIASQQQQQ
jgi:hypothetical protein